MCLMVSVIRIMEMRVDVRNEEDGRLMVMHRQRGTECARLPLGDGEQA